MLNYLNLVTPRSRKVKIIKILTFFSLFYLSIGYEESSVNSASSEKSTINLPDISGYLSVSTPQTIFCNNLSAPSSAETLYWQEAHCSKNKPESQDNEDGTISDLITQLI